MSRLKTLVTFVTFYDLFRLEFSALFPMELTIIGLCTFALSR